MGGGITRALRERKPANAKIWNKWSGICFCIFGLIWIWMSVVSVSKYCGCLVWYKSAVDCMRNANKCPKNPIFRSEENEWKVVRNPHADPDHHQNLITSRGSPLPNVPPAKLGRHPFPRLSVILFTEWQNDHITSALLAEVITKWMMAYDDVIDWWLCSLFTLTVHHYDVIRDRWQFGVLNSFLVAETF